MNFTHTHTHTLTHTCTHRKLPLVSLSGQDQSVVLKLLTSMWKNLFMLTLLKRQPSSSQRFMESNVSQCFYLLSRASTCTVTLSDIFEAVVLLFRYSTFLSLSLSLLPFLVRSRQPTRIREGEGCENRGASFQAKVQCHHPHN